jgi:hypothetical protein
LTRCHIQKYLKFRHETASPLGSLRPVLRRPMQILCIDSNRSLLHRLSMVIDDILVDADYVLSLVVVDQVEVAKR